MVYFSFIICKVSNIYSAGTCAGSSKLRYETHFDKLGQIGLKLTLVEKCFSMSANVECAVEEKSKHLRNPHCLSAGNN